MNRRTIITVFLAAFLAAVLSAAAIADDRKPDTLRDILVTLDDEGVTAAGTGVSAPYRKRKRYAMETKTRRQANDIASEYALVEVARWPIRSLSEFCFVYRVDPGTDRSRVIERLRADSRVASAQALQRFETLTEPASGYDDTYTDLQRGLEVMDIPAAHRYSRGQGVRVAIVDSHADANHEDLEGRVNKIRIFVDDNESRDTHHGTAVASVIGATASNAKGIVGIAPESVMELYVACWAEVGADNAVCDSFTLAKALDEIVDSAPDVLNLSLIGPYDPLLARLLDEVDRAGIVAIAARSSETRKGHDFPASLDRVISVGDGDWDPGAIRDSLGVSLADTRPRHEVHAPGARIMVAIPDDAYDFRSGSSLAAAHVSGVVALLLAVSPKLPFETVRTHLRESQLDTRAESLSVNACLVLQRADRSRVCP
jgi:subtilisin family serine protease